MTSSKTVKTHTTTTIPPEPAMYSVTGFCCAHSISRALLYKQCRAGKGPKLAKCGSRTLISKEAAQEWRASLEQAQAGRAA